MCVSQAREQAIGAPVHVTTLAGIHNELAEKRLAQKRLLDAQLLFNLLSKQALLAQHDFASQPPLFVLCSFDGCQARGLRLLIKLPSEAQAQTALGSACGGRRRVDTGVEESEC